jgi:hypothetical protein
MVVVPRDPNIDFLPEHFLSGQRSENRIAEGVALNGQRAGWF